MASVKGKEKLIESESIDETNGSSTHNIKSDTTPEFGNINVNDMLAVQVEDNERITEDLKDDKIPEKNIETSKKGQNKIARGGKFECSGMIFMCSSKTKMDCYNYKVLGLPASKKDIVLNIYKGMRLFLFDFELKLMYGIYKAAGPGGYNIEPKAFKSAFPSQVPFVVLDDCLPLGEERFKKAIKDNYYSKNKFRCELTSVQVRDLCKLFQAANRGSEAHRLVGRGNKAERPHTFVDRARLKLRNLEQERHMLKAPVVYERELAYESQGASLTRYLDPSAIQNVPPNQVLGPLMTYQRYTNERPLNTELADPYALYSRDASYHDRVYPYSTH